MRASTICSTSIASARVTAPRLRATRNIFRTSSTARSSRSESRGRFDQSVMCATEIRSTGPMTFGTSGALSWLRAILPEIIRTAGAWRRGMACAAAVQAGLGTTAALAADVRIDADFPGGNVVVERVEGDNVFLQPDVRETRGRWFYWYFRVRNAGSRALTFNFTVGNPISVRGPAIDRKSVV